MIMQNIRLDIDDRGVWVLTFDRPNSPANLFDRATLEELDGHITAVSNDGHARGLVLMSAKDAIFVAGVDLHVVLQMNAADLAAFIELGQTVFTRLAALKIPTVAAIHGAALGGGYEVALACDWRVASRDPRTKVGLPETKLGLIPAWGGSTRLPRLVGVPRALDLILGGKTPGVRAARKLGLIDEIVPREHLRPAAAVWLQRGKHPRSLVHSAPVNAVVDLAIAPHVRRDIATKTRGLYPAVQKAMEVVLEGSAKWNEADSLKREREAIGELVEAGSTRNLVNLFFLQERAKHRSIPNAGPEDHRIERTAVIGAGVMGGGIAQWLSSRGLRVLLRDIDPQRVGAGMATVESLYMAGVRRRLFTEHEARAGLNRISPSAVEVPLRRMDLVIEAAVEKMDVKQKTFRRLDELVGDNALLATNTSALSITELASVTRRPERIIGIHFFNPVHSMQLVEVVTGRGTSPETAQRALRFVQRIGKLPVLVKDSPGFLVNRILLPYLIEAARLFERGVSATEIDDAMLDFGMPMGPLRLIDEVGADIAADVAATLAAAFPGRMNTPAILPRLIDAGWLGRKAGKGFYVYDKGNDPAPNEAAAGFRASAPAIVTLSREALAHRMALLMINEAALCLAEGLVETAGDIDFAMVMGTGFAPFRGGPLRCADSLGAQHVVDELSRLADNESPHYQPCPPLVEMAHSGNRFHES
jgi:3-hydroxyacyl-CoA dehydrogenase/enoyl-CoA hydratase/3-hydroxybutyryl-CoA epimerase